MPQNIKWIRPNQAATRSDESILADLRKPKRRDYTLNRVNQASSVRSSLSGVSET